MVEVALKGVTKRWGSFVGVRSIDLVIRDREFIVFLGPSGCGKTTTMRMIAGLEDPTEGDILIGGTGWDRAIGGSGEDLLIGGSTSYDQLDEALLSLASIWNGAGTASERRTTIQQGNVYQQTGLTVLEDNNLDVLLGGENADLYFSGLGDYVCNEVEDLFAV